MNITRNRSTWFTISGIAVVASILLSLILQFNLGLDFTGGARWQVDFSDTSNEITTNAPGVTVTAVTEETEPETEKSIPTTDEVRSFFANRTELTKSAQIQTSDAGQFLITIEDLEDAQLQAIKTDMEANLGKFAEVSYRKVDSSIGKSFQQKSVVALLVALAAIIITVAIAFRKVPASVNPWRFGGVAIVALFHDVVIILGVFAVLSYVTGLELDLQFITALLATLGFSVNDTIVILDRVRENIGKQKAHETFEDTIENSVQQTLMRSINTSISTLLPLLGLLFFGAESIFYFVLALVLGILVGTYSSIFLAAPLLASWKTWSDAREA